MSAEALEKVCEIEKATHVVFLVSSNKEGITQSEGIISMSPLSGHDLKITGWFSAALMSNLDINPHVTLIIWDIHEREGYQLKGRCIKKREVAYLDGFVAQKQERNIPQIEWELMVRIDSKSSLCRHM